MKKGATFATPARILGKKKNPAHKFHFHCVSTRLQAKVTLLRVQFAPRSHARRGRPLGERLRASKPYGRGPAGESSAQSQSRLEPRLVAPRLKGHCGQSVPLDGIGRDFPNRTRLQTPQCRRPGGGDGVRRGARWSRDGARRPIARPGGERRPRRGKSFPFAPKLSSRRPFLSEDSSSIIRRHTPQPPVHWRIGSRPWLQGWGEIEFAAISHIWYLHEFESWPKTLTGLPPPVDNQYWRMHIDKKSIHGGRPEGRPTLSQRAAVAASARRPWSKGGWPPIALRTSPLG
ncbi:uncharacterized protein VTP21DRAFT_6551 [Calcarisporiella thermophila]|uniref:uncharacterized protein n=1 Tax=Calcarisporiella thermophila TaxID=911321 RepID=UPI003742D564